MLVKQVNGGIMAIVCRQARILHFMLRSYVLLIMIIVYQVGE